MKKTILTLLIGLVIGITGTVIASNYLASEIAYNDTTVENALNELYDLSNASVYTGETSITPTEAEQTISSNGKRFTSDITIGAIPNTYKDLTSNTTVDATNLLDGVTAYNSNGDLITGNISTNCVHGARTFTASEASKDIKLADFTPTFFIVSGTADNRTFNWIYDKNMDATHRYKYVYDKSTGTTVDTARQNDIFDTTFKNPNNTFVINFSSAFTNSTISYTICK